MGYYEFSIAVPAESKEALMNMAHEAGSLGAVENDKNLVVYFQDHPGIEKLTRDFSSFKIILKDSGLPHDFSFDYVYISERDWNESWKKKFQPIDVGQNLSIIPPWEEPKSGRINLIIDPGMAFGTGHHGTTRGCLLALDRIGKSLNQQSHAPRILDLGTGSGVLAIAAARAFRRHVLATDIDPHAVRAARANARLNRAGGMVEVVHAAGATARSLRARAPFDLIFANILLGPLQRIASPLRRLTAPGARIVLSGVLPSQANAVFAAYRPFALERRIQLDSWTTLVFARGVAVAPPHSAS